MAVTEPTLFPGATPGERYLTLGGVPCRARIETLPDGDLRVISALVCPGLGEAGAAFGIVSIGLLDGTKWQAGVNGWMDKEFPTIEDAVQAVLDVARGKTPRVSPPTCPTCRQKIKPAAAKRTRKATA